MGDFSTSLTTSAVSRDLGFVFVVRDTRFPSAQTHWFLSREYRSFFDDFVSNRMARARFLHHCGGVAHQTSLRSRSIMMCYANSPPFGEAGSLFS